MRRRIRPIRAILPPLSPSGGEVAKATAATISPVSLREGQGGSFPLPNPMRGSAARRFARFQILQWGSGADGNP